MRTSRTHDCGFSLIELMITIVVLAVLAAIALPSFRSFMQRNAVSGVTNELIGDFQYARGEAASRRGFVSMCVSTDGTSCDTSSGTYDTGWLIYTDKTPNHAFAAADGELLRVGQPDRGVSIRATDGKVVTFNGRGELVSGANLDMVLCAKSSAGSTDAGTSTTAVPGKLVQLSAAGRVATRKLAVGTDCSAPASASTS